MLRISIVIISFNFVNLAFSSSEKNFKFDSILIVNDSSYEELSTNHRSGGCTTAKGPHDRNRGSDRNQSSDRNRGSGRH